MEKVVPTVRLTEAAKAEVRDGNGIKLLTLAEFTASFSAWGAG